MFNNFTAFVKYESITEAIVEEVKEHFEYVNTKHGGHEINNLLNKLSNKVRLDIKKLLFTDTLKKTNFFHAFSTSSLRVFLDFIDLRYYKIHADIIRCNDVQKNIYVVSKGTVDIVIAGDTLITLTRGGAFGCFTEKGKDTFNNTFDVFFYLSACHAILSKLQFSQARGVLW